MALTKKQIKQRRQRLVVLADFLEKEVKPILNGAKFAMGTWGVSQAGDVPTSEITNLKVAKECGYAACAVGWGLVCPQLKRPLREVVTHDEFGVNVEWFDGLGEVFGLTPDEAWHVFMPSSYQPKPRNEWDIPRCRPVTIPMVARRLRSLAAKEVK